MTADNREDPDLLRRLAACDEHALAELFALHRERLRRMVEFRLDPRLIRRVDPDDILVVRFEDLVTRPVPVMTRIAEFFEIVEGDEGWIARAAELVRGLPPTRFEGLAESEQRALEEACRAGQGLASRFDSDIGDRRRAS